MRRAGAILLIALAGCAHTSAKPAAPDCHVVESQHFVFHDDPWINLHHFLYEWARNVPERLPQDRMRGTEILERTQLAQLSDADSGTWQKALDYYREHLVQRDVTFDRSLIAIREELGAIACSGERREIADADLRPVLSDAMRVYRKQWWPAHRAANSAWIAAEVDALQKYESTVAQRLAAAYGGEWPAEKVRVDVSAYANWAGAYTTNRPNRVTVSSISYKGLEALEILFHEVSHATFFEQRLLVHIDSAFRAAAVKPPDTLLHVLQFITPAEILRNALRPEDREHFLSVGDRVSDRGRTQRVYRIAVPHWKAFLAGTIERGVALERIANDLK